MTIPPELMTARQRSLERRNERLAAHYRELRAKYPQAGPWQLLRLASQRDGRKLMTAYRLLRRMGVYA